MNDKNRKLPEVRRGGRIDTPLDKEPIKTSGAGGQIKTNWANIRWTKKKITFVSLLLGTPYVIALVVSWVAINRFITYILLALALLFVLLVWFLRSIDNEEF
ncbi:MAG: hypothetical protein QNJ60_07845 [Xenococcaceae cyanobacterium MO_188.B19]|nr:hypothetical protein [Xenococcaceae cyanobacterium MO_188.B19]